MMGGWAVLYTPAGRAALLSSISAARSVLRMLLFWGPGALLNRRDILTAFRVDDSGRGGGGGGGGGGCVAVCAK